MKAKCLLMLIVMSGSWPVLADWSETINGYQWWYKVIDGFAEIQPNPVFPGMVAYSTSPASASGHLAIPAALGGYAVTSLGTKAFYFTDISRVTIPDSVRHVKQQAFCKCPNLTSVSIPRTVIDIGESAFSDCGQLTDVEINDGVKVIGAGAFKNCTSLVSIVIPDSVEGRIGAFPYCHSLKSATIGNGVQEVSGFESCTSLVSVVMGNSVTNIDSWAFANCYSLKSVKIPEQVRHIGYGAFSNCCGLEMMLLPDRVNYIENMAFANCSAMQKAKIGDGVTYIGENAFQGCIALSTLDIGRNVQGIGRYAFLECKGLQTVTLPETLLRLGSYSFAYCDELKCIHFEGPPPQIEHSSNLALPNIKNDNDNYSTRGTYTEKYKAEWEAVIDNQGHWHGLAMEERVLMPLSLAAESADWSEGSITLKCEDADRSGAVHKYTLEYMNAGGAWEEVDGAKNKLASKVQNANGQEVWMAQLTDASFSSRLGGIPTVEYRVKDENGRVSNGCVTRNRHGIFVGVGEYGPDYPNVAELKQASEDAMRMKTLSEEHGGFLDENVHCLVNQGARYADVDNAFRAVAEKTQNQPGDICVVYFSTHGGVYGDTTVGTLVLYDKPPVADDPKGLGYHEGLLAKHIRSLDPMNKGVAVVCIISACHSGAFLDDDNALDICSEVDSWCHRENLGANVAWITAADANKSSTGLFDMFLLEYGWEKGWAMKDSTSTSFYELGKYAIDRYNPIAQKMGLSGGKKRKDQVLSHVIVGERGAVPDSSLTAPSKPINLSATTNRSDVVRVEWEQGSGGKPDWYCVIRRRDESGEFHYYVTNGCLKDFPEIASHDHPMQYAVAAFNGAGVGITHGFESGWRTIDIYRATFFYDLPPRVEFYSDRYVTPFIESGGSLSAELRKITETVSGWNINHYEFKGWKSQVTDSLFAVWRGLGGSWYPEDIIVNANLEYHAVWATDRTFGMTQDWLTRQNGISTASNGDIATAAAMPAANGRRTVGECFACGIDPEDPDDDLKIVKFEMQGAKPEITLNHTKDGAGNSFEDRVKILGKENISDLEWQDVPPEGDPKLHFFTVDVEMP